MNTQEEREYIDWFDVEGNPVRIPMNEFLEEVARTVGVLVKTLGITSRRDFKNKVDEDADLRGLDGIGKARQPVVEWLNILDAEHWVQYTGLPAETEDSTPYLIPPPVED